MKQYTPKKTIEERLWTKVAITANPDLCWEWQASLHKNGYGRIKDKRFVSLAHRIAWELTYGKIPDGLWVLHRCDNRKCCNPKHLFLGTHQDNMADMVSKFRGKSLKGEKSPMHKLTAEIVNEIRLRYARERISQKELGRQYGVVQSIIGYIINWKIW